ncbi:MAG: serine/threonine protein kinase, partial [Candidatus Eremiobacteraeota bacterium]|nr:serine/threonine protein kinase [Candidatus Eremiobacteraeota bacterium]
MSDEESTVFRAEDDGTVFQSDEEKLLAQVESLPETPPELEGYELISRLGEGTFGTVWQGKQVRTGQAVAVKLLRGAGLDWKILQRETERLREVAEHPYIVTLLDADLTGDPAYIVMPYLKNGSLADVVSPTLEQVESWLTQIAEALVYAHDKGILHCDIKPSNILLDDEGRARLVDFGQAVRSSEEDVRLGTLGYMPPEQVAADAVPSTLWDVYALGATAYRLLSGQLPRLKREDMSEWQHSGFNTAAATQYSEHLRSTPVEWLHYLNPSVDEDFAFAIMRCLVPSPEKRMQGASELLRELERRKAHVPLESARPWKMSYRSRRWVRRNKLVLTLLLVLSVGTGTPLAWYMTDPLIGIPTEAATTPISWPKLDSEFPEVRELDLQSDAFSSLVENRYYQELIVAAGLLEENPPSFEAMENFVRRNTDLLDEVRDAADKPDTLLAKPEQDQGWLLTAACETTARALDERGDHDRALRISVDRLVLGHRYVLHEVGQKERGYPLPGTYPGHIAAPIHFLERRELRECSTDALRDALSSLRPMAGKWPVPELLLLARNDRLKQETSSREFDA